MSNKSPGFIDGLEKGITVYDAFGQIRTGALSVVRDLISLSNRGKTLDNYRLDVPNLPLAVTGTVARTTETALVSALVRSQVHPLLRITKINGINNLAGFRDMEPGGDFSLIEDPNGFVFCLLGSAGIKGSGQKGPVGKSKFQKGQEVHRLKGEHRDRFDWVADGVYRGLQATKAIRDGEDATRVLRDSGRHIRK